MIDFNNYELTLLTSISKLVNAHSELNTKDGHSAYCASVENIATMAGIPYPKNLISLEALGEAIDMPPIVDHNIRSLIYTLVSQIKIIISNNKVAVNRSNLMLADTSNRILTTLSDPIDMQALRNLENHTDEQINTVLVGASDKLALLYYDNIDTIYNTLRSNYSNSVLNLEMLNSILPIMHNGLSTIHNYIEMLNEDKSSELSRLDRLIDDTIFTNIADVIVEELAEDQITANCHTFRALPNNVIYGFEIDRTDRKFNLFHRSRVLKPIESVVEGEIQKDSVAKFKSLVKNIIATEESIGELDIIDTNTTVNKLLFKISEINVSLLGLAHFKDDDTNLEYHSNLPDIVDNITTLNRMVCLFVDTYTRSVVPTQRIKHIVNKIVSKIN